MVPLALAAEVVVVDEATEVPLAADMLDWDCFGGLVVVV
jgi:hypothetical protein